MLDRTPAIALPAPTTGAAIMTIHIGGAPALTRAPLASQAAATIDHMPRTA